MENREDIRAEIEQQLAAPELSAEQLMAKKSYCTRQAKEAAAMGEGDPAEVFAACMADPAPVSIGAAP